MSFSMERFQPTQHSAMHHKFTEVTVYGMPIHQPHFFFPYVLIKTEFRWQVKAKKKKIPVQNFANIHPARPELFHADGQKGRT